jgi:uncharacterized Zn finger protein (UPF0148 family)
MGNAAWICFDYRSAVRRSTTFAGEVSCPICGKPCAYLGYKIPVPPKARAREWAALHQQLSHALMKMEQDAEASAVRYKHSLEQEIARLEAMSPNKGRAQAAKRLRKHLSESNS